MAKRNRNRGATAPTVVVDEIPTITPETVVQTMVSDVVNDLDAAMATMIAETPAETPVVETPYDPTAPVDGAPNPAAAIAAGAAAIAAARTTPTAPVVVIHPRRNAPGVPDGLVPVGTWIHVPGLGDVEIRQICVRVEYDDRAPQWGNLSMAMVAMADGTPTPTIVPIGSRVLSSRGRIGTVREIFYHVRTVGKTMHNVAHSRVSHTRPASGPYGTTYATVIPTPTPTPGPAVRAVDGTVVTV